MSKSSLRLTKRAVGASPRRHLLSRLVTLLAPVPVIWACGGGGDSKHGGAGLCSTPTSVAGTWQGCYPPSSCGSCSSSTASCFSFDVPLSVATNGGAFTDDQGNTFELDTASCTAVPAQVSSYGGGTTGATCGAGAGTTTIDFNAATETTGLQCPQDGCISCGNAVAPISGGGGPSSGGGGSAPLTTEQADVQVVDALWRTLNTLEDSGSWYVVGSVNSGGSCSSGSYTVSGTIGRSASVVSTDLDYVLDGCTYDATGESVTYTGSVHISDTGTTASGSTTTTSDQATLTSSSLSVTGTVGSTTLSGYDACSMDDTVDATFTGNSSFIESGTLCGRKYSSQ